MASSTTRTADTLVVGASAAGLATAAELARLGVPCEILEAGDAVAGAWQRHYDRLHLHTPRSGSGLPGLAMPASWPRYPSRDQMVTYLEAYREHHDLQPRYGERVERLERVGGSWVARTRHHTWRTSHVVVATGATRVPVLPTWPGSETFRGEVLHSTDYRDGRRWQGKDVVVVGFGNSACEIAVDLVESGAHPHLCVRSGVNVVPRDLLGIPVLQLGVALRRLPPAVADALARPLVRAASGDIGRLGLRRLPYGPFTQMARHATVPLIDIGTLALLRAGRVTVHGDIARFIAKGVVFADGTSLPTATVVLATGYRPGLDQLLPDWRAVCDGKGVPVASGGPTALPGLYFCGYHVSPGGMLREIGIEATRLAGHLADVRSAA